MRGEFDVETSVAQGDDQGSCFPKMDSEGGRRISSILAVLFAISGLWNSFIWRRLTPVYTATSCGHIQAELNDLSLDGATIKVGLQVSVHCQNPNPYAVEILSSRPGRVLVGAIPGEKLQGRTAIGHLEVVPGSMLPSAGEGIVRVQMNAKLSGEASGMLIPEFLGDSAIPILMELRFNVGIKVYFLPWLLPPWQPPQAPSFKKACGLNMMGVLVNQFVSAEDTGKESRLGPLVCRDSFTGMVIPPVGESPPDGKMDFTAAQVAPAEVWLGEIAKDVSLFLVVFCSFFCCAIFTHLWMYGNVPRTLVHVADGCGTCCKTINTLPWNSIGSTLMSLVQPPRPRQQPPTESLLGSTHKASMGSSQYSFSDWKDAQRKETAEVQTLLKEPAERPRRESNASTGNLSSNESQAMFRAAGVEPGREGDEMVRQAREKSRTLMPPDRDLSQHSSRHGSRSTSPQRKPRITQDEPRGSRARGSSAGSEHRSGDEATQDRSRRRLSSDGRSSGPGTPSRSRSPFRNSSPSYTSMPV